MPLHITHPQLDPELWVINYSDDCEAPPDCAPGSGQQIRFQTSRNASLRGPWAPRRDVPPFRPSAALGYSLSRWDTINPYYDEPADVLYGWWTAGLPQPPPASGRSAMGFGTSKDGLHWTALPPAVLTWPSDAGVTAAGFEIGGVAPITLSNGTRRWYASVCMAHQELPAAIAGKVSRITTISLLSGTYPHTVVEHCPQHPPPTDTSGCVIATGCPGGALTVTHLPLVIPFRPRLPPPGYHAVNPLPRVSHYCHAPRIPRSAASPSSGTVRVGPTPSRGRMRQSWATGSTGTLPSTHITIGSSTPRGGCSWLTTRCTTGRTGSGNQGCGSTSRS